MRSGRKYFVQPRIRLNPLAAGEGRLAAKAASGVRGPLSPLEAWSASTASSPYGHWRALIAVDVRSAPIPAVQLRALACSEADAASQPRMTGWSWCAVAGLD